MSDPLDAIWPIFEAESREQIEEIASGVLRLETQDDPVLSASLRRLIHSLKGSAASLGFMDVEKVAHAVEDVLEAGPGGRLRPDQIAALLRACTAVEASLSAEAHGRVEELDAVVAGLRAAAPGAAAGSTGRGDGTAAALELLTAEIAALCRLDEPDRAAHARRARELAGRVAGALEGPAAELAAQLTRTLGELAAEGCDAPRLVARAAAEVVALRSGRPAPLPAQPARPEAPAAPPPTDGEVQIVRVEAERLDRVAADIDQLAVSSSRQERRCQDLSRIEQGMHEALRLLERTIREEVRRTEERAPFESWLERLQRLVVELGRETREGRRVARQDRLVVQGLRNTLQDLRMIPVSSVLGALRPMVRDLAARLGKEASLEVAGGQVRLDRRVLEGLRPSIVHLVRNALDHGIEEVEARRAAGKPPGGVVEVRVEERGDRVSFTIRDDGRGLSPGRLRAAAVARGTLSPAEAERLGDAEAARLAFRAGISTAAQVTAVSGRGVGLDVVAEAVQRLGGEVDVTFEAGHGTTFRLDVPLTISGTTGVLVRAGGGLGLIPAEAVEQILLVAPGDVRTAGGLTVAVDGREVPFVELAVVVGEPRRSAPAHAGLRVALVVAAAGRRVALAVEEVLGERPMVVCALGKRLVDAPHIGGAAVLDDGRVVAVLRPAQLTAAAPSDGAGDRPRPRVVVADDSLSTRAAVRSMLEIAGYEVLAAADGAEALELVRTQHPQLVVSDVQMPRLDGLELARRVRLGPGQERLPVILVTSLSAPEERAAGLAAGADAYLVKQDVGTGKLLEVVRQLLPG